MDYLVQDISTGDCMTFDEELQKYWDDAIAKWKADGEHPLARHPLAVRCDGYSGCYTVAPIRIWPDYSKRYCADHLPIKPEGESSTTPNPTLEFLKDNNLPLTRAN